MRWALLLELVYTDGGIEWDSKQDRSFGPVHSRPCASLALYAISFEELPFIPTRSGLLKNNIYSILKSDVGDIGHGYALELSRPKSAAWVLLSCPNILSANCLQ